MLSSVQVNDGRGGLPAGGPAPDLRPEVSMTLFAGLVSLAAFLRLHRLGDQPLWLDEAYTFDAAGIARRDGALAVADFDHIAPLYYWLAGVATAIGGDEAWALRLPATLAGLACVPAIWWCVRRIFGSERVALGAAAALAVSPYAVWYSQEARAYTLLTLLAILYVGLCWPLQARTPTAARVGTADYSDVGLHGRPRLLAIFGVTALALWTHHVFIFLMAAWGVFFLVRTGPRSRWWWSWSATQAVALLTFLPWIVLTSDRLGRSVGALKQDSIVWVPYTYFSFLVGQSYGPTTRELRTEGTLPAMGHHLVALGLAAVVFALAAVVGVRMLNSLDRAGSAWVACWVLLPVVFLLIATYAVHIGYNPRYVTTASPAVAIVVGASVSDVGRHALHTLVAALAAIVMGWGLLAWYVDTAYAKDDLRSAERTLDAEMRPGDVLIIGNSSAIPPLEAYGFRCPARSFVLRDASAETTLSAGSTAAGRTFVLENRQWEVLPSDRLQAATEHAGTVTRIWEWPGVRVMERPASLLPETSAGLDAGCGR